MEWISVKERLPEPNERILAYCPDMTEADIGPVSVQWGWTCKRKRSDISHWMPLPESPNERRDREADVEEYEEMTIEAAIKHCEEISCHSPFTPCEREHMHLAVWLTELVSLRAQQHPNEPLTLDELREMDGEPVWCADTDGTYPGLLCYVECVLDDGKEAHIWLLDDEGNAGRYNVRVMMGRGAKFYRQKPEQEV